MYDIWTAIAEVAASLPQSWVEELARAVEKASASSDWSKIVDSAALSDGNGELDRLGDAWESHSEVGPSSIAAGLRSAAAMARRNSDGQKVELVWTGPGTSLIPMRRTEQVIQQIIDAARERIWLTSYVFVYPDGIIENIRAASTRGVEISAILESPKSRGGQIGHDPAENLRQIAPAAHIFEWTMESKKKAGAGLSGCVHAKCLVADSNAAFITSANFTDSAMDRNMEMGVLINGGAIPSRIADHFLMLCDNGIVCPACENRRAQ